MGATSFTAKRGYGFSDCTDVEVVERSGPDVLRCDFVQGASGNEFIIEVPRGQYELLLISGDENEDSVTIAQCENSMRDYPYNSRVRYPHTR